MWPFSCKQCIEKDKLFHRTTIELNKKIILIKQMENLSLLKWHTLSDTPPLNTNLLVANKDFSYFGFLYMDDGWDNARRINMQYKDKIWPTYTNPQSIAWWLNIDLIKKEQ